MIKAPSTNRIEWVDYAKGMGILFIIHLHVFNGLDHLYPKDLNNIYFIYVPHFIRSFHMAFFFFLSGLFINRSIERAGKKEFLLEKIRVLAWPYLIWSLLQGLIHIFFSSFTNNQLSFNTLLISIICKPYQQFWFLYALCVFSVLFLVAKKYKLLLILSAGIMFLISYYRLITIQDADIELFVYRVLKYYLFFVMGSIFMNSYFHFILKSTSKQQFLISSFGFFFLNILIIEVPAANNILISFTVTVIGIYLFIWLSIYLSEKKVCNTIRWFGIIILPIYVGHMFGVGGSRILLYNLFGINNITFHLLFGTGCGILVPIIIYFFVMKINIPYLYTLSKRSIFFYKNRLIFS